MSLKCLGNISRRWIGMMAGVSMVLAWPAAGQGMPALTFKSGHWDQVAGKLRPDPASQWRVALVEGPVADDVVVETQLCVPESGVVRSQHNGAGRFITKGADLFGESNAWSDAAFWLCYNEDGALPKYYRVEVSACPQARMVGIWKMGGGYLAVKPLEVPEGKPLRLRAAVSHEGSIRVYVDDKEVLAYHDPQPLKPGKAGVGALKGIVEFSALSVKPLTGMVPVPMPERGQFQLRGWLGNADTADTWLFDGEEPVLRLIKSGGGMSVGGASVFEWVTLRPGVAPPICYLPWQWTQWTGDDTDLSVLDEFTVVKEGAAWECLMKLKPRHGNGAAGTIRVTLSRDAARQRYVYEVDTQMTVAATGPLPYRHPLEFLDPWPAAGKGLALAHDRAPRQNFDYIVWEQPAGKAPRNITFANDYLWFKPAGQPYMDNSTVKPLGVGYMGCAPDVNVMVEYLGDPGFAISNEMCNWGYDWHHRITNDGWRKTGIPAGTKLAVKFRLTHEDSAKVSALYAASSHISSEVSAQKRRPVFEWPVTTFGRAVSVLESHNSKVWMGGEYVTNKGQGDRYCIRLNPKEILTPAADLGTSLMFPVRCYTTWQRTMSFDAFVDQGTAKLTVICKSTLPRAAVNQKVFEITGSPGGWRSSEMEPMRLSGCSRARCSSATTALCRSISIIFGSRNHQHCRSRCGNCRPLY